MDLQTGRELMWMIVKPSGSKRCEDRVELEHQNGLTWAVVWGQDLSVYHEALLDRDDWIALLEIVTSWRNSTRRERDSHQNEKIYRADEEHD